MLRSPCRTNERWNLTTGTMERRDSRISVKVEYSVVEKPFPLEKLQAVYDGEKLLLVSKKTTDSSYLCHETVTPLVTTISLRTG